MGTPLYFNVEREPVKIDMGFLKERATSGLGLCSGFRPLGHSSEGEDDLPARRGNFKEALEDPQMA